VEAGEDALEVIRAEVTAHDLGEDIPEIRGDRKIDPTFIGNTSLTSDG